MTCCTPCLSRDVYAAPASHAAKFRKSTFLIDDLSGLHSREKVVPSRWGISGCDFESDDNTVAVAGSGGPCLAEKLRDGLIHGPQSRIILIPSLNNFYRRFKVSFCRANQK